MGWARGRAPVAVLFCDLVGSTELLSRLGDEASDRVRREVFAAMRRPLEVNGGDEVKSQGDGLMVAFRTPADAVAGGVGAQRAISRLASRHPDLGLQIRVGVAAGEATHEDGDWFGTPPVEAARLCSAAEPGQVLVTGHVAEMVDDPSYAFDPVAPLRLKGLPGERPAAAARATTELTLGPPLPPGLDVAGEPDLAGREEERARLVTALEDARAGTPRTVLLVGEAGVGKTRLAADVAAAAGDVRYGRVADANEPFAPLTEALGAEGLEECEATIRGLGAAGPLVVVLDDVHRAPPALAGAIADLAQLRAPCRLLLLCLARDDTAAMNRLAQKLEGTPGFERIDLGPLPPAATATLLDTDDPSLAALVHADSGGNPARIVEAHRALDASGHLRSGRVDEAREVLARLSPYKGLASFGPGDGELFFGRERAVEHLVERAAQHRLLAVVGPSGGGKSSVVRAGLVPRTATSAVITTPGPAPEAALTAALASVDAGGLLVVDQFEELFTLCPDEDERRHAIDALLAAAAADRCAVVLVLRSDFFGAAAAHAGLAEALEVGTVLLPPMEEEDLRAAIEGPAEVTGLRLESGLAEIVVADVIGEPGGLPLLSHAMLETWRRRRGRLLTIEGYREAGGARGAIGRTADLLFTRGLDDTEQAVARSVFLRLTELGEGAEDTRRRASPRELAGLGDATIVEGVLAKLVAARLVVTGDDQVEVAHEALIREWPRLRSWIDADRDEIRAHRRLGQAAAEWDALGRGEGDLYRGARLEGAVDVLAGRRDELDTTERDFLDASVAARDSAVEEQQAHARAQVRANRRLRGLLVAAAVALVVALVAGSLALGQRNRANDAAGAAAESAALAEDRSRVATARGLVARSTSLLATQPDVALLLAVEALHRDSSPETRQGLVAALRSRPDLVGYLGPEVTSGLPFSVIAIPGGVLAAGNGVTRWDATTGRSSPFLEGRTAFAMAAADASMAAAVTAEGIVRFDPATGEEVGVPIQVPGAASLAFSRDGDLLVAGTSTGTAQVFDAVTGRPVGPALESGGSFVAVAFDPVDGRLVLGGGDGYVRTVDPTSGELLGTTALPMAAGVQSVAVRGSTLLVSDGSPLTARYDIDTQQLVELPIGEPTGTAPVDGQIGTAVTVLAPLVEGDVQLGEAASAFSGAGLLAITPDGAMAVVVQGGAVTLVPLDGVGTVTPLDGVVGSASALSLSADGSLLVVSGDAGSSVWSMDGQRAMVDAVYGTGALIPKPESTPDRLAGGWSPDGTALAVSVGLDTTWVLDRSGALRAGPIEGSGRFSDDTTLLVGTSDPFAFRSVRATDGADVGDELDVGDFATVAVAASPARDRVALGGQDGEVRVGRRGAEGELLIEPLVPPEPGSGNIVSLSFSPDGDMLAVIRGVDFDVYAIESGELVAQTDRQVRSAVAFAPGGDLIAVGQQDGSIALVSATTLQPDGQALSGHTAPVVELAFRPDGGLLASLASDGTVRLWDVEGRQGLGPPLPASPDDSLAPVRGLALSVSSDGRLLLAPGRDGVTAWRIDPEIWVEEACRIAGRNLSGDEWVAYLPPGEPYRQSCPIGDP